MVNPPSKASGGCTSLRNLSDENTRGYCPNPVAILSTSAAEMPPSGTPVGRRRPVKSHDFAAAGDVEFLVDSLHVGADRG